eukprot:6192434-Pleurochrysis_carterae.AAC.1
MDSSRQHWPMKHHGCKQKASSKGSTFAAGSEASCLKLMSNAPRSCLHQSWDEAVKNVLQQSGRKLQQLLPTSEEEAFHHSWRRAYWRSMPSLNLAALSPCPQEAGRDVVSCGEVLGLVMKESAAELGIAFGSRRVRATRAARRGRARRAGLRITERVSSARGLGYE